MGMDCVRLRSRYRKRSGGGVRTCECERCVVFVVRCGLSIGLCDGDAVGVVCRGDGDGDVAWVLDEMVEGLWDVWYLLHQIAPILLELKVVAWLCL